MDKVLNKIYHDISHPAGYSSVYKLYKAAKKQLPSLTIKKVKLWLSGQDAYTLHKPLKRKFKKRKTIASGLHTQWETDLMVFESLARYNSGNKYILVCIDVFSRYCFCEVMKKKNADAVVQAFTKIFKNRKPDKIASDSGREYLNKPFQEFLKKHNVKHFLRLSDVKAALAERLIRTLKERLFKYFTANNTLRYVDVLQNLVKSYNSTIHSSLNGLAPNQITAKNEKKVWKQQYGEYLKKGGNKGPFQSGDKVILSKLRKTFDKGYQPNWTKEYFIIVDRLGSSPPVWRVMDAENNIIEGTFYAEELQKIS